MKHSTRILAGIGMLLAALSCGQNKEIDSSVPVTGIILDKSELELTFNEAQPLKATIQPGSATSRGVLWTSSSESVATVSTSGVVTGMSLGTADITATSYEGGFAAVCRITVVDRSIHVTGVTLDRASAILYEDGTLSLKATVSPSNTNYPQVTWTSSDPAVATVSSDGTVKPVSAGTTTITVTTADGGFEATCAVEVKAYAGDISVAKTYVNPAGDEYPVMGWFSLWGDGLTSEKYTEMRDAGFNLSYSQQYTVYEAMQALQAAKGTGVKIMARFVSTSDGYLRPENVESNVKMIRSDETLAGYWVSDEPSYTMFPTLRTTIDNIRKVDDTKFIYVNLLPNYAPTSAFTNGSWGDYAQAALDEMRLGYISYDFYPVTKDGSGVQTISDRRRSFFSNLEVVLATSQKNGTPWWGFALSTSHEVYPEATLEALKFQVYHNLAYGAQGLQYFTYVTVPGWDGSIGPMTYDPFTATRVHARVKSMNTIVKALTPYFLDCSVKAVGYVGAEANIPHSGRCRMFDTVKPSTVSSITTTGTLGFTASVITKAGKDYLFVVSQDINNAQHIDIAFTKSVTRISETGATSSAGSSVSIDVAAGDMLLFEL